MLAGGAVPMGARIGATMRELFPRTTYIDASLPMPRIVAALQAARPELLSAYAGTLSALAEEQLAGRLAIAPRLVQSTSEVLSPAARARIAEAFGVEPANTYAMTEAGMVAATCARREGLHVLEDGVILEVLDDSTPWPASERSWARSPRQVSPHRAPGSRSFHGSRHCRRASCRASCSDV